MTEKKHTAKRLVGITTSTIWGPLILIFVVPALMTVILPGFRSFDAYLVLLYGPFIVASGIIAILIRPLFDIFNYQFRIPNYGPQLFSDIAIVILINLFLITVITFFLYRRFDSRISKVSSLLWVVFIVEQIGSLPLLWLNHGITLF